MRVPEQSEGYFTVRIAFNTVATSTAGRLIAARSRKARFTREKTNFSGILDRRCLLGARNFARLFTPSDEASPGSRARAQPREEFGSRRFPKGVEVPSRNIFNVRRAAGTGVRDLPEIPRYTRHVILARVTGPRARFIPTAVAANFSGSTASGSERIARASGKLETVDYVSRNRSVFRVRLTTATISTEGRTDDRTSSKDFVFRVYSARSLRGRWRSRNSICTCG